MAATQELHTIGQSIPKPDAWLKATGTATYAGDVRLPGMLEAKVLRSPYPHARIVSIDTSAAEALPGVFAVVDGRDVAPERIGNHVRDRYALVRDKATYVGEPVAAVAAVDEETALRALELIKVDYEVLPAVVDAEEALRPDAPVIHPDIAHYDGLHGADVEGNRRNRMVHEVGDVDAAFAEAGLIVHEANYDTPRQSPGYTEPHTVLAQVDGAGKFTIWASIKSPFRARMSTAWTLGVKLAQVRYICPMIGGDFGAKGGAFLEPIAALLARKAKRPVRISLSRAEEITAMLCRPGCRMHVKMGVRPDGTLVALESTQIYDIGAADDFGPEGIGRVVAMQGAYRIPNLRLTMLAAYTNTMPAGHVRAPSAPHSHFAIESHVDVLAHRLGMDPLEFRLKNVLRDGDTVPTGQAILRNSGLDECIRRAQAWIKSELGPKQPNQGIGVAIGAWSLGPKSPTLDTAATLKIDDDGNVVVLTGIPDQGGGQWSMVAQVTSEVLGVAMDQVSVIAADTEATPHETGIGGSNATYRVGNSVRQAAEDARARLFRLAGPHLSADEEELACGDGDVYKPSDPAQRISIARLARQAINTPEGSIIGTTAPVRAEEFRQHGKEQLETADAPCFACHVAQVRVDPESGKIDVERYFAAHDVGHALNPMACQGQIEGGVAFGLGYALTEEILHDQGTPTNANLWEYLLPNAPFMPQLDVAMVEIPSTYGPWGAKGIGEAPCVPTAAVIANAVADAIGARVTVAPLTPERVLRANKEQQL
jgi:CO/xanthine dehydrogenase Mo-binding subunit